MKNLGAIALQEAFKYLLEQLCTFWCVFVCVPVALTLVTTYAIQKGPLWKPQLSENLY